MQRRAVEEAVARDVTAPSNPLPTREEADAILGSALFDVVESWQQWVHRQVDSIHPSVGAKGRRRQSLDCEPVPDPGLAWAWEERSAEQIDDVRGQIAVPLSFIEKGRLREFDARDANDNAMTVLGTQDTWRYGLLLMRAACAQSHVEVTPALDQVMNDIIGPHTGRDDRDEFDRFLSTGRWRDFPPVEVESFQATTACDMLRQMVSSFLLVGLISAGDAGKRQVLKYSYDWLISEGNPTKFWEAVRVAGGWASRTVPLPLESPNVARSYHLEFQVPEEAQCRLLEIPALPGEQRRSTMVDDTRRPVLHVHASYPKAPIEDGSVTVTLRPWGMRMVALLTTLFTAAVTFLALVLHDAMGVWRARPEGPATVLLVAPAVYFTFLATRGESALIQSAVAVLRVIIFTSGLSLFLVAASLVGVLRTPELEYLWTAIFVWNALCTVYLSGSPIAWAISWTKQRIARHPERKMATRKERSS